MTDTILLDPDLFMALGFSAEANGGVGRKAWTDSSQRPLCIEGHAMWVEDARDTRSTLLAKLDRTAVWSKRNDACLAGVVRGSRRVPFERWCEIVGVDVQD